MPRRILIVDDSDVDRSILCEILSKEYSVVEAKNGKEALPLLINNPYTYSAVITDIRMPVMDGYELVKRIRGVNFLAQIPIIITTGESDDESSVKAISCGANNFILKPFNTTVLLAMLKNNITLRESSAIVNEIQKDKLTGVYNRNAFLKEVERRIHRQDAGYYVLASFDIIRFKVINDQYGTEMGDRVLKHVGSVLGEGIDAIGGICCRITDDRFAVLYPAFYMDTDILDDIRSTASRAPGLASPVSFCVGRYIITDLNISPSIMYDRAFIAGETVKGSYGKVIALYDDSIRDRLINEQQVVNDMERALADEEFELWYQPQYNHSSGALIGAEALVRWRKDGRIIPPISFINVFEKNGFIYQMDMYVWKKVCQQLRVWSDSGFKPLPVSVNVSRFDLFQDDFVDIISGLIDEYGLPMDLLRLEVTESAFSDSPQQIVAVVAELVKRGFIVEIDDFGSGYSSLNTLKDVPAQILKLDMKFLDSKNSKRGGSIVESVVRMARWLGMTVIAEGVETKEQADYLKSIGCQYLQGYFYAKPMSAGDYETLLNSDSKESKLIHLQTLSTLDNNEFWNPESMDTLIFNSYVGAACILEFAKNHIEMLRATDHYVQMLGNADLGMEDVLRIDWGAHMDTDSFRAFCDATAESRETHDTVYGEYVFIDLPGCPGKIILRAGVRVIATVGEKNLVYCLTENITEQRRAEQSRREAELQLEFLVGNIPGGLAAFRCSPQSIWLDYCNKGFCDLFGVSREEYAANTENDLMHYVFEDDRETLKSSYLALINAHIPIDCIYRVHVKDGSYRWIHHKGTITGEQSDSLYIITVLFDITRDQKESELLKIREEEYRIAALHGKRAICRFDIENKVIYIPTENDSDNDNPYQIADVPYGSVRSEQISVDTADTYIHFYEQIIEGEKECSAKYKKKVDGSWRWLDARATVIHDASGRPASAIISYADATAEQEKEAIYRKWQQNLNSKGRDTFTLLRINLNSAKTYDTVSGRLLNIPEERDADKAFSELTHEFAEIYVTEADREKYLAFVDANTMLADYYRGKRTAEIEFRGIIATGETHWLRLSVELVEYPDTHDIAAYMMFEDINESKLRTIKTQTMAETDTLTGLLNRSAFINRINEKLANRGDGLYAMFLVDIDDFKLVNDSFGHAIGDQVLTDTARTIQSVFRDSDLICRMGGDEFLVCMSEVSGRSIIQQRSKQLLDLMHTVFHMGVTITVSIGIAICPDDGETHESLFIKADRALYHAKSHGKNNCAFYNSSMHNAVLNEDKHPAVVLSQKDKPKMLIVDDKNVNLKLLKNVFANDCLIETVSSGAAALDYLRKHEDTAVILLDLMMPDMDGFAVLERLRANEKLAGIPVVVVSAMEERDTALKALKAGASDFVMKPVDATLLRIRVESAISKAENERLRAQNRYLALLKGQTE